MSSSLMFTPTLSLMDRLQSCLVPGEKDFILDCTEVLQWRASSIFRGKTHSQVMYDNGVVEACLDIFAMFPENEVVVRCILHLLAPLCKQLSCITALLLQLDGRDILENLISNHKEDHDLVRYGHSVMKSMKMLAGSMAEQDTARMAVATKFCVSCRHQLDALAIGAPGPAGDQRRQSGAVIPVEEDVEDGCGCDGSADPFPGELKRIEKVITHMKRYPTVLEVILPCIDSFISLGKGGVPAAILESGCLPLLIKAMDHFPKQYDIAWKGGLAIMYLAKSDAVCSDLGKAGGVQALIALWKAWEDNSIRQIVLWGFSEMCRLEPNRLRMSNERLAVLLRDVLEPEGRVGAKVGPTPEQLGTYCIPLRLKRMYRKKEFGSPFAKEEAKEVVKKAGYKPLKSQKPQFGTVNDEAGGVKGLLDD
ncbi:unnamed protein product [Chrysoparadoxa australica]